MYEDCRYIFLFFFEFGNPVQVDQQHHFPQNATTATHPTMYHHPTGINFKHHTRSNDNMHHHSIQLSPSTYRQMQSLQDLYELQLATAGFKITRDETVLHALTIKANERNKRKAALMQKSVFAEQIKDHENLHMTDRENENTRGMSTHYLRVWR